MNAMTSTRHQLVQCWAVLMTMTALSLWVGEPTAQGRLTLLPVLVLLMAAGFKGAQILWVFLNLRASSQTWKATFCGFLLTILLIVQGCAAIAVWR